MDTVWIQLEFQPNLQRNQPPPRLIQRGVQRVKKAYTHSKYIFGKYM